MPLSRPALAVLAVLFASGVTHAGFVNTTATLQRNQDGNVRSIGTAVVGPGVEFMPTPGIDFDISDTAITLSLDPQYLSDGFGTNTELTLTFAGLTRPITGVGYDPSSTLSTNRPLTFTADSVTFGVSRLIFTSNQSVLRINATFANATGPAVAPLPAPLLCGVGLLGGLSLRKRRRATRSV